MDRKRWGHQITVLLPNEPVVIVRESLCKEWYYLYARNAAGWIRKDVLRIAVAVTVTYSKEMDDNRIFM